MVPCQYCQRQLSNKYTLKTHQQSNKKCRQLRNLDLTQFECHYCHKQLTSKRNLARHVESFHEPSNNVLEHENRLLRAEILALHQQVTTLQQELFEARGM